MIKVIISLLNFLGINDIIPALLFFTSYGISCTMATSGLSNDKCPRESGQLSTIIPQNHGITTRKMVPIMGRASS